MAKTYLTLDTRIDTFKDEFNNLVNKVGDLSSLTTSASGDSDLVQAINEHSAELGTITASAMTTTASTVSTAIKEHALELGTISAGAMGTSASTVSTAIAELDAEADSDRSNFANNIRTIMLDPDGTGVSKEVTSTANNSTNESTFITFVDGATGAQGIETDTGLTYNPSSGLITTTSLAAATLDISGNVDIDGTLEVGAISGTSADFDAGVTIDNITIDGTEIDLSSGDLTLDVAGDIILDAAGNEVIFKDAGTSIGHISMSGSNITIKTLVQDEDFLVQGNDGGSSIDALTLDMSAAGAATFNSSVTAGAGLVIADGATIGSASDLDAMTIASNGQVTLTQTLIGTALDISGNVDIDGTLEADAITVDGITLAETISDTVGGMVGSNTETGITVTYEDGDNTLDFVMGTTQTTITSLTNAALVVGRDADNDIDFATDNNIIFRAAGNDQIKLIDGALAPVTDNDIDLGTSSLEFKNAFFDGTVTSDAFAGPLTGDVTGNASGTAGVATLVTTTAENTQNSNRFVSFVDAQTGNQANKTDANLTYNPNTNMLTTNVTGNVTGNLTGNLVGSGTDQPNITSLGTLSTLSVDNININGNTIISTDNNGDINITPQGDGDILLDGAVNIRAGVVTGATAITSDLFTGALTGNAATATSAATLTTARTIGGVSFNGGANINLPGVNAAGNQATSGLAASATILATTRAISITGDVTATGVNFNGSAAIALNTSIANNAVVTNSIAANAVTTAKIADDAVTYAKLQNLATADRVLGSTSTGLIGEVQIVADMIATDAVITSKILNANVTLAKIQTIGGNSLLVRDASSTGALSAKSVADGEILIGNGAGFNNEPLTGDVTMTKAGVTTIANNAVTTAKIGADAVTAAKIGDNVINSEHYADLSIDTAHIADGNITAAKMAVNSINSDQYVDASIDHEHLSADCVDKDNLATLRTLTINDSAGTAQFIMFGAGA